MDGSLISLFPTGFAGFLMDKVMFLLIASSATAALAMSIGASAQTVSRPDPANPKLEVPPVRYESAFAGYRPFRDGPVASWRESNELVEKLGGWKAFASDKVPDIPGSPGSGKEPASIAPSKAPGPAGHAGHKAP